MRRTILLTLSLLLAVLLCVEPAHAWGPRAREAVITTAANMISRDGSIPLRRLGKHVIDGAMSDDEVLIALHPGFENNPAGTIEGELRLLQSVRGERVTPYYAYRLGLLGKMVDIVTTPLYGTSAATYRKRYLNDVEAHIEGLSLSPRKRRVVDPPVYLVYVRSEAAAYDDVMVKDYQDGLGFEGVASTTLSEAVTRSVNAVCDMWYTALTEKALVAGVTDTERREYLLHALAYYIDSKNEREMDAAAERMAKLRNITPEVRKRMADLFYNGKYFERAMDEYRAVLKGDPGRQDVIAIIADYYVMLGVDAEKDGRLEAAADAYREALAVNQLHPEAQGNLLKVEKLISERDARLVKMKALVDEAKEFEEDAEQEIALAEYAEALELLTKARDNYQGVTDEFAVPYQAALAGLTNVRYRIREIKQDLHRNASTLSGSGFEADPVRLASERLGTMDESGLRSLLKQDYNAEMKKLRQSVGDQMRAQ